MKAQTIITITQVQTEESNRIFKEILNSPGLLKRSKGDAKEAIAEFFDVSTGEIEIDFKEVE